MALYGMTTPPITIAVPILMRHARTTSRSLLIACAGVIALLCGVGCSAEVQSQREVDVLTGAIHQEPWCALRQLGPTQTVQAARTVGWGNWCGPELWGNKNDPRGYYNGIDFQPPETCWDNGCRTHDYAFGHPTFGEGWTSCHSLLFDELGLLSRVQTTCISAADTALCGAWTDCNGLVRRAEATWRWVNGNLRTDRKRVCRNDAGSKKQRNPPPEPRFCEYLQTYTCAGDCVPGAATPGCCPKAPDFNPHKPEPGCGVPRSLLKDDGLHACCWFIPEGERPDFCCPSDRPSWNGVGKTCEVCPSDQPMWDATQHVPKCVPCPEGQAWNASEKQCKTPDLPPGGGDPGQGGGESGPCKSDKTETTQVSDSSVVPGGGGVNFLVDLIGGDELILLVNQRATLELVAYKRLIPATAPPAPGCQTPGDAGAPDAPQEPWTKVGVVARSATYSEQGIRPMKLAWPEIAFADKVASWTGSTFRHSPSVPLVIEPASCRPTSGWRDLRFHFCGAGCGMAARIQNCGPDATQIPAIHKYLGTQWIAQNLITLLPESLSYLGQKTMELTVHGGEPSIIFADGNLAVSGFRLRWLTHQIAKSEWRTVSEFSYPGTAKPDWVYPDRLDTHGIVFVQFPPDPTSSFGGAQWSAVRLGGAPKILFEHFESGYVEGGGEWTIPSLSLGGMLYFALPEATEARDAVVYRLDEAGPKEVARWNDGTSFGQDAPIRLVSRNGRLTAIYFVGGNLIVRDLRVP